MANIFDKDTASTDNHLLNEQFHAFSKSPSSPGSTLGGASNRSGHTVSASDVWAEKIPAFFYPKADSDYAVCKANAKLNDICRWGDEIQIWDGEKFVKFADNYAAIPDGHEFLNEDGEPVVRFHKSRVAYNLNDTNNAYDNSLDASGKGASAKILGWDKNANDGAGGVYTYVESAPQFITQFVAPTDNIVKGVPSKGYGPIVMVGGSPLTEDADSTAGYIANNFAGIIQFNERKAQGTVTVHAFEYCGKTLGTTVSDIENLEQKVNDHLLDAAGKLEITVLTDKLPKKPFFADDTAYVKSYGFEWEKLPNNIYTNKFEVKVAQSVSGLAEFTSHTDGTVLTPSSLGNGTCKLVVYSVEGSSDETAQLTEVAVSQANTFDTSTSIYAFKFDNQISLSAGGRYRFCFRNNDETNALHCLPVIINSSNKNSDVTKNEILSRYITGETAGDWWGCWARNISGLVLNGVEQAAYGPKASISGLTPTPDADGSTLIGENCKIYLIPNTDSENQNVYDEFVWTNNTWEKIGSTKVDLSGYAKSVKISDKQTVVADNTTGVIDLSNYEWIDNFYNTVSSGAGGTVPNEVSVKLSKDNNNVWGIGVIDATSTAKGLVTLSSIVDASNTGAVTGAGVASAISGLASDAEVVKTIKMNNSETPLTPTNGQIDLGTVVTQVNGPSSGSIQATPGVVSGQIQNGTLIFYTQVASSTKQGVSYLYDKTASELGSAKDATVTEATVKSVYDNIPTTYVRYINDGSGNVTLKAGGNYDTASALTVDDSQSNLWGLNVECHNTEQCIIDGFIGDIETYGNIGGGYISTASLPAGATKVIGNFVYGSNGKVIDTIRAERMVSGFNAYNSTNLTEWVADMPNLKDSYISSVSGPGVGGFASSNKLITFIGDLSSLETGDDMFYLCTALTTFIGDLSSLETGSRMFVDCKLNSESVECILESIPDWTGNAANRYLHIGVSTVITAESDVRQSVKDITGVELTATVGNTQIITYKGWTIIFFVNE